MMPPNRFCSWFPCAAPLRFNLLGNVLIKDLAQLFRGVRGIQVPPEALDEILSRASSGVLRHTKESIDHARRHRLSLLRLRSHVNKQGLDLGKFSTSLLVKLLHLGGQLGDDLLSNFHPVDVLGQHSLIVVNAVTLVNRRNLSKANPLLSLVHSVIFRIPAVPQPVDPFLHSRIPDRKLANHLQPLLAPLRTLSLCPKQSFVPQR
mmetsp:Transcript_23261/g.36378  ORF Transcript_23261/g.36378 Transcript_23261/m.36378 type:complete len:205 (-) Transcript_23261:535-1149(-)